MKVVVIEYLSQTTTTTTTKMHRAYRYENVALSSRVQASKSVTKDNKASSFSTPFATNCVFEGEWDVALSKMIFSSNVFNIAKSCNRFVISKCVYDEEVYLNHVKEVNKKKRYCK